MRFLYNRKSDTRDRLDKASVETFVPMRCEIKNRNGKKIRAYVPVIWDLLFVHSTEKVLAPFLEVDNYFQYRYRRGGRQAEPLIIPDSQMEQFINAEKGSERPIYFTPQELNIDKGTRIRIHGGTFDPQALAKNMMTLIRHPELRDSFGQAARKRAYALFTSELMTDRYKKVYREQRKMPVT